MKIAYFPAGGPATASSRLRVHKIADVLRKQGHDITINGYPWSSDVIVVQKRIDLDDVMKQARDQGKLIVYDVDDYIRGLPVQYADVITVDTPAKQELYPRAVVIPDALDVDESGPRKTEHADYVRTAVYVGNAENWYHAANAMEACKQLGIVVVCITDLGSSSYAQYDGVVGVQWGLDSVDSEMVKADIAICPYLLDGIWGADWVRSKSANRLLKAWALGLPVIGTPIPSYVDAGLHYQATTVAEWVGCLRIVSDRNVREIDATRGRLLVDQYRAENVARQWLEVFNG